MSPCLAQPFGGLLDALAREAVDDAALAFSRREKIQQLLLALVALGDGVGNVRAVEAAGEDAGVLEAEAFDDVGAGGRIGRRRQRDARDAREVGGDGRELAIFRPEVMPPLRDAVRLVDGEEADVRILQHLLEARRHQPLRRHVEQLQPVRAQVVPHGARLVHVERGVEHGSGNARLFQRLHLVAHQRDQRRDDDADTGPAQRRHLIAQRLARPGREQHHGVAAFRYMSDNIALLAAKLRVAKHVGEDGVGILQADGKLSS